MGSRISVLLDPFFHSWDDEERFSSCFWSWPANSFTSSMANFLRYWILFSLVVHLPTWHIISSLKEYLSFTPDRSRLQNWGLVPLFQPLCQCFLTRKDIPAVSLPYPLILGYCFHFPHIGAARWQWAYLDTRQELKSFHTSHSSLRERDPVAGTSFVNFCSLFSLLSVCLSSSSCSCEGPALE